MNNLVFNNLSYGVYIVSTMDEAQGRPTGCVVNSVMQVSAFPATVAISVHRDNYTNQCIRRHKRFAVSILPEGIAPRVIGNFGFRTGREFDKFAGIAHHTEGGIEVVDGACGYLVMELVDMVEAETHTVFIGRVVGGDLMDEGNPMTYAYYHQVVKGKTPKNATTYIEPEESKQ